MEILSFRVGDKVWDVRFGNGYVKEVYHNTFYSVTVAFKDNIEVYTSDGKHCIGNPFKSLYHGHDLKVIGEQIPIREVWVNLWWNSITKEVVRTRTFYETEDIARKNTIPENQGNLTYLKTIQIKIPHS
jgi:hypothetical protein